MKYNDPSGHRAVEFGVGDRVIGGTRTSGGSWTFAYASPADTDPNYNNDDDEKKSSSRGSNKADTDSTVDTEPTDPIIEIPEHTTITYAFSGGGPITISCNGEASTIDSDIYLDEEFPTNALYDVPEGSVLELDLAGGGTLKLFGTSVNVMKTILNYNAAVKQARFDRKLKFQKSLGISIGV